jgi:hypothetical protein
LHTDDSTAISHTGVTPACLDSEGRAFIKADRMYKHNVMRINYTTSDVRRAQDVINPSTPHCNVMLLGRNEEDSSVDQQHPYLYACVLGIYHVNATYVGPGMVTTARIELTSCGCDGINTLTKAPACVGKRL